LQGDEIWFSCSEKTLYKLRLPLGILFKFLRCFGGDPLSFPKKKKNISEIHSEDDEGVMKLPLPLFFSPIISLAPVQ
jgi:hypothetical protein